MGVHHVDGLGHRLLLLGFFVITLPEFGVWSGFSQAVNSLDKKFLTVPRVINFGLGGAKGERSWTAEMILTYMFSLMGIQSSPAFTMSVFGIKNPEPLPWQQACMSTFVVGFAPFFFTAFQGMGARVLELKGVLAFATDGDVVPILMKQCLSGPALAFVCLGAMAAIHSTAAPCINTGGSILLRDVYFRYIRKEKATHAEQIWMNRLLATVVTVSAVLVSDLQGRPGDPGGRAGGPGGHGGRGPDLQGLAQPTIHALRLLGGFQRPAGGLRLPGPGDPGRPRNPGAPAGAAGVAGRRGQALGGRRQVAFRHEGGGAPLVLLRHRTGLHPGKHGFQLRRVPAPLVVADLLADGGDRDDAGPVLQAEPATTNATQIQRADVESHIVVKEA